MTCAANHLPPAGAEIARRFNSSAALLADTSLALSTFGSLPLVPYPFGIKAAQPDATGLGGRQGVGIGTQQCTDQITRGNPILRGS